MQYIHQEYKPSVATYTNTRRAKYKFFHFYNRTTKQISDINYFCKFHFTTKITCTYKYVQENPQYVAQPTKILTINYNIKPLKNVFARTLKKVNFLR